MACGRGESGTTVVVGRAGGVGGGDGEGTVGADAGSDCDRWQWYSPDLWLRWQPWASRPPECPYTWDANMAIMAMRAKVERFITFPSTRYDKGLEDLLALRITPRLDRSIHTQLKT